MSEPKSIRKRAHKFALRRGWCEESVNDGVGDDLARFAEKEVARALRQAAAKVDELGQPKAQRKSTAQLLDYIKRGILYLSKEPTHDR